MKLPHLVAGYNLSKNISTHLRVFEIGPERNCNISNDVSGIFSVNMCDMMLGIRCIGVGASQRIPLSVLVQNPHKGLAQEISHETGRGLGKEGPRAEEKEEVKRRRQNREVDRIEQPVGESRWQLGSMDSKAGLANIRRWVSIPGDFVGVSLEYTLAIAHRMLEKCHKLLPSCTWS